MVRTLSTHTLGTGEKAPDFELKGVDGKTYSLKDLAGPQALLVVFICNHCPYVHARLDDVKALQAKFAGKLQVVGINSNDPQYEGEGFENMKQFAAGKKINFPYLIDDSQEVARAYGAVCTPDPYLFDSSRRLVFHGRINDAMDPEARPTVPVMENNIKILLEGQKIEKDFDPSVGCSIKWKN